MVTFEVSNEDLDPDLEGFFDEVMREAEARIKQRTPVLSGTLQESIEVGKTEEGYEIGSDVDYFPYVEFGTSKMSGAYMVRTTIEELPVIAERTKINWKK